MMDHDQTTRLLQALSAGDTDAADDLYPLVYDHLRRLAGAAFLRQPAAHTLQPTALVNELFVKLSEARDVAWEGRAHFLAVAARAMRQILVDHARGKAREKRGGAAVRVTLSAADARVPGMEPDLLDLDNAVEELSRLDPRQGRLVLLRFFGGLTVEEAAEVLAISRSTVEAEWRMARAWLRRRLDPDAPRTRSETPGA